MGSIKGSSKATCTAVVVLLAISTWCIVAASIVPLPTDVTVICPNYNCTLTWTEPENMTLTDDIKYTVQYEAWDGDNFTLVEIPDCIDTSQLECNLVEFVTIDTIQDFHTVVISSIVNGRRSEAVETGFFPNFKATLEHPDIVLIDPVLPTEFTVHIFAPLSPYEDPNTGELYRVDELPPFKRGFLKSKFRHSSILYLVEPSNKLEEIQEETGPVLDLELTFSDLQPYIPYRLEVISYISKGLILKPSKVPTVITVTTSEDVPSEGPILLSIIRKSPTCSNSADTSPVVVSWKAPPPEHHNGQLTHYSVQYMLNGRNFSQATAKNCNATDNLLVLELERWQAYEFAVLACNAVGCAESRHKTLFNLQAIKKGSKPENISVDYTPTNPLLISWIPPETTECIDKYSVIIEPDDDGNAVPIKEMVYDTTMLQINTTLRPGNYMVTIRSFVRSGYESSIPGATASMKFKIENKTVITNHIILPLVITSCFIFSAVMVAITICAKWVLRPFDFHLEKTRALKLAREYNMESNTYYRQTEHEVYDPLPGGSRRPSRTSSSSRPSLSTAPRGMLWSSSSTGNHQLIFPQNGDARMMLPSHSEEPQEVDALLPSVLYSPVSTDMSSRDLEHPRRSGNTKKSNMSSNYNFASSGSDGSLGNRPMLTIEVSANNISQRVVRWTAGGTDDVFDEDSDPFDDVPKAEDFDESDAAVRKVPQVFPAEGRPSSEKSRTRLNYPSLVSQSSVISDAGSTPPVVINATQAHLFEPVNEADESEYESHRTPYAQLAASNAASSNQSISNSNDHGRIAPYSQISNSHAAMSPSDGARENRSGSNNPEGYSRLALSDQQQMSSSSPAEMRRAISNPGYQPYVQIGNSPMQQRRTRSEDSPSQGGSSLYASGEPTGLNSHPPVPTGILASPVVPRQANTRNNGSNSQQLPTQSLSVGTSPAPARRDNPTSGNPRLVSPLANNPNQSSASYLPSDSTRHLSSPVVPSRRGNIRGRIEPYMQLSISGQLTPSGSPTLPRGHGLSGRGRDFSRRGHDLPRLRLPTLHAPGSPLLPSRALDTAHGIDSDSDDSDSIESFVNNHVSPSSNDSDDRTSLNYPSLESQVSENSEASSVQPAVSASKPDNSEEYIVNGGTTSASTEPTSTPNNGQEYICNGAMSSATEPTIRTNTGEEYICNGASSSASEPTDKPNTGAEYICNSAMLSASEPTRRINTGEEYCNGVTSSDTEPTNKSNTGEEYICNGATSSASEPTHTPNNGEEYICNGATSSATEPTSTINASESRTKRQNESSCTVPVDNGIHYVEQVNGELVNSRSLPNGNCDNRREEFISEDEDNEPSSEMSLAAFVNGSLSLNID